MNKDEIYSIDGEILKNGIENEQNKDKILDKIRGKIGTKLEIEIKRLNPKTAQLDILKFKIIREKIKMSTVASELLAGDIAYVKIYEFTFATKDEFDSQYKNLLSKGAKYLILDLRDNPGGVFFGAVDLVKRFIGENKFIVSMKNKDNFESYSADKKAIFDYSPLVVLINKNSASSAEIFAGVIRDYKRGVLVGEKTFGKGSVQTVFDLENGKGLRLTTGKYFLPHGDCIDKNGIDPNFYVAKQDDKDNVLDFAIQLLRNSQILKKIGH
jgi:carboxyl-terminal processing protease